MRPSGTRLLAAPVNATYVFLKKSKIKIKKKL